LRVPPPRALRDRRRVLQSAVVHCASASEQEYRCRCPALDIGRAPYSSSSRRAAALVEFDMQRHQHAANRLES